MTVRRSDKVARRLSLRTAIAATVTAGALVLCSAPAVQAYNYESPNTKWGPVNLNFNVANTSQDARTAIDQATSDMSQSTDLNITNITTYSGWAAANEDYGLNGWEGRSTWYTENGITKNAQTRLNNYYLSGRSVGQLRVVWLHEMGHSVGLAHVSGNNQIMYQWASTAYNNGARFLDQDSINGINAKY